MLIARTLSVRTTVNVSKDIQEMGRHAQVHALSFAKPLKGKLGNNFPHFKNKIN